jgi:hypothetical protein
MPEQTVPYVAMERNQTLAARRVQLMCQLLFHSLLGVFTAVAACVFMNYLTITAVEYFKSESILLAAASCVCICMIVVALCCVHDFTVEVIVRIRQIRTTYRRN